MYRAGINAPGLCIGLPFAIIGQYLSELVYSVLGDAGVYYGIELAVVKPCRITGFPFLMSDPQYRGSLLTRHVNLSVFFDSCLTSKLNHWSSATVCYRPPVMRAHQCGGVTIGFLAAPHDQDS
jgi:hypothetical protein